MSRPQLSDEAAAYVRELVLTGQLRPGEFVRVDRIAAELEMSVTPVREGLLTLRGEGFLELAPRRGFVVAELTQDDIRDLFWVQASLAGELAARATARLVPAQLSELESLQDKISAALERGDLDAVEQHNHAFHRTINLAAQSPKLIWFLRAATRYVPERFFHRIGGWPDASRHDHTSVLEAFRTGDAEAVRRTMEEHIIHAGQLLIEYADLPAADAG